VGEVCLSSGCATSCPRGLSECAGTCVDTGSDSAHCGGCDRPCEPGEGCVGGSCEPAIVVGPPPARCIGGGPPIEIGGSGAICTGAISGLEFAHGLCTCDDIGVPTLGSDLLVDAYDSTRGPYVEGGLGGDVGANGGLRSGSRVQIHGGLTTTAPTGLAIRSETIVRADLRVREGVLLEGTLDVDGDAFVGGAWTGGASASVAGTLHTPLSCASVPPDVDVGACVSEPVEIAAPCRCDAAERLPIEAIVAHYASPAHNDDDELGLSPDALAEPGAGGRLDLPCGYYYLSRMRPTRPTTIAVHGRTALFVGGSIEVSASLTFALDPGATLDVFVAGTITASAALRVGSPAYAAQSRVYVGGVCAIDGEACTIDGDCCSLDCGDGGTCVGSGEAPPFSVSLTSSTDLAGLFYAPNGLFRTSSELEMYGAILAGSYHSGSATRIHYDGAAAVTIDECPEPEPRDGGMPVGDAGAGVCRTGAPTCGPGLPACGAGEFCVASCCVFFG
jgi:Stigma-specific protein, Stig1